LCEEKGDIKTSEWIECSKVGGTPQVIERILPFVHKVQSIEEITSLCS